MLDLIGRWHDLMLLQEEASAVLGKRSILTEIVAKERDVALHNAKRPGTHQYARDAMPRRELRLQ